ncbi:NrfD/PsrC family molybdoenzyme membrane anchor subunit [Raoultibacter phocaeensis]|uniref:NrfD/PsrC family molybdoenzyme membrane anchor subunit n=1 Tax=Raoultibacter phocaeensis TaxID=2479841 RepID=UPI00111AB9A0|nr:NrfD/PsrC family molybdoenzyme membrane anchor subunit [Raoultibacter phocaeensis]
MKHPSLQRCASDTQPFPRKTTVVWAVIVVALLGAGAFFMFDRLANGLSLTGATNAVPWGLWVAVYIWFSGLAGGLYLISALTYLLRIPRFASVARLALGMSIVSLVVSMIFIGIDLGAIRNSWTVLPFFHWSSPLSWEIKAYIFFLIVSIAQLALVLYNDRPRGQNRGNVNLAIRVLAGIGVATSFVGPPGGTGMFFAAVKTRGLWEGGITSVLFYVMALVSAAAFLIVVCRLLARLRAQRVDEAAQTGLVWVFVASLAVLAFCVFFQLAPILLSNDPRSGVAVAAMLQGYLAPLFWIGEIGLGFVVPAVLLIAGYATRRAGFTVAAALSALVGILSLRYVFVVAGFSAPLLEGLPQPIYLPSVSEVLVALFVLGMTVALFGLAVRFVPLEKAGAAEGFPGEPDSCAPAGGGPRPGDAIPLADDAAASSSAAPASLDASAYSTAYEGGARDGARA